MAKVKDFYTLKYRDPGSWWPFPRKIKKVVSHWLDDMASREQRDTPGYKFGQPICWGIKTKDDRIITVPVTWYFEKCPDWTEFNFRQMSKEAGQQIQRA